MKQGIEKQGNKVNFGEQGTYKITLLNLENMGTKRFMIGTQKLKQVPQP